MGSFACILAATLQRNGKGKKSLKEKLCLPIFTKITAMCHGFPSNDNIIPFCVQMSTRACPSNNQGKVYWLSYLGFSSPE